MRGLARLEIDRMPGVLRYRLEVPDRDGTSLEEIEHPLSDDALADALGQAGMVLGHPEDAGFAEHAAIVGQRLYRSLVPQKLREELVGLRLPILLLTNLPEVPFELFHDGRDFLGLRFAVGRRVYTRPDDHAGTQARSFDGRRLEVLVIGSDPRGDLPSAQHEAEVVHARLADSLGDMADLTLLLTTPVAGQATRDDVADRLLQGIDVLHYCGHVEHHAGTVGLLLADDRLLSVDDIANNLGREPVVFLNGCASTRGHAARAPGSSRDDLASVAGAFMRGGARAVIGTTSDVSDRCASVVADEFYRLTTAGVPLGEALRRARAQCRERHPDSPTWLSFVLYGSPTQLLPNQHGVTPGSLDGHSRLAVFMSVEMVAPPAPGAAHRTAAFERRFREALAHVSASDVLSVLGSQITARFTTASGAVAAALRFQELLAGEDGGGGPVRARIGIDLREVAEFDPDGQGTLKVIGAPAEIADRLRRLALPGQIILSRSAFDGARWHARHPIMPDMCRDGPPVQWLAHGQYVLESWDEPLDVFEAGIEGRAPLTAPPDTNAGRRRLETDEIAGWRPAVGAPIPRREAWVLERKLGAGGFGEVWLARHQRLHEARVFKFCFDKLRLRSFRQETRIFRLLRGALGTRADIIRLYDVELERPPYSLESEYLPHGNLSQWAAAHGGLAAISLDLRLEIFGQVATALSAAHSAGVLHKDLKPSNILMREDAAGAVSPCLADFGIGSVGDPGRLLDLGITPTAPTTTTTRDDRFSRAGTRLYAPPESHVGSVHTERGDVYALGVLLFQLVLGDFDRPLASGWDRLIDDELLRTDIGVMVEGDPAARLGSAAQAAQRIRRLPERRAELRERQRAARRRHWVLRAATAALVVALGIGVALRSREASQRRTAEEYRQTIQHSAALLDEGKSDEARRELQAAPPHLRHWEWRYLWQAANRIVYEGEPYRAVMRSDGRLSVDTAGDAARTWRGRAGIPLVADDTLCFAWLAPGGGRVVSVPRATEGPLRWDLWDGAAGTHLGGGALHVAASTARQAGAPTLTNGCPDMLHAVANDDESYVLIDGGVVPTVIASKYGAPGVEITTPEDRAALRAFGFALADDDEGASRWSRRAMLEISASSADGGRVAAISRSADMLELRDARSGATTSTVRVPSGVWRMEFSPGGDKILGLSWDQLWLWTVGRATLDFVSRLGDPSRPSIRSYADIRLAAFNDDGSQAIALSDRLRIFDTSGVDHRSPVRSAHRLHRLSPSGRFGLDERHDQMAVVDLSTGRDVPALPADVSGSDSVHAWFGEADTVISLSRTGDVRASDATTGRILWSRLIGVDGAPGDADFAAARVAVSTGNVARVFELPNATEVATVPLRGGGFRLSPDGRRLLTFVTAADDEGDGVPTIPVVDNMELWDLATTRRLATYRCGSSDGLGAAFSPDGRWLLTNCGQPTADVWDASTGASVRRLTGFDGGIYSADFSRDGRRLVTIGQWDDTVEVWEVESTAAPTPLAIGQTKWSDARFSPDGRRVVGARGDGTVTIWDVAAGKDLLTLGQPFLDDVNRLASASFTADGRRIVFLCEDETRIWGQ